MLHWASGFALEQHDPPSTDVLLLEGGEAWCIASTASHGNDWKR